GGGAGGERAGQDGEIVAGEVSRVMLHELEHPCPPTIISKSGLNVRFWHKADITGCAANVCFSGNSGHEDMSALPPPQSAAPLGMSSSLSLRNTRPARRRRVVQPVHNCTKQANRVSTFDSAAPG